MTEPKGSQHHHSLSMAYQTYLRHDRDEQVHWDDVCKSFRQYATFAMAQWANQQYRLHALPESQRRLLPAGLRRDTPQFSQRAEAFKDAAIRNQFCLDCILRHAGHPHSQDYTIQHGQATDHQMSSVSSVLKSLARDWSAEGKAERDMSYGPLLSQVQKYLPVADKTKPPRICVPGAGVGRLPLELAALEYSVQGNEYSLYMLLASDFILNGASATPENPLKISPFLLESRNVHAPTDPCRVFQIPDVDSFSMVGPDNGDDESTVPDFSMAAGEFVSIYSAPKERGQWNAVVACFFLDTAPCIVEYLQVIHQMLKPGGFLFSFGPLVWHWSAPAMRPDDKSNQVDHEHLSSMDKRYMTSVDLCWEDVREVLLNVGFEIVEEHVGIKALYTSDRRSMVNMSYRCINFVARKKRGPAAAADVPTVPSEDTSPPDAALATN